ncbi:MULTISPECIES: lysylphosphatidylglycerol synthase domain-containing protein [unclassified Dyella]|uniref:lysylphosphatidylglycerol synthase domain-containing protein n=1 Tax=unclassified Dyella TaxID=2634549 RepID=UPI000C81A74B|nr:MULTISPECIES: lysylphosphatidylglycerol synthase domain-containing protein [unclassified Dyella]MDR3444771.1 lysylphosphatidylglycerol synthase transmembrane domain-containing protein [Dyella sp.]PMQ06858.1 hypothetical protein DyAD56_02995 [Dyella sp. AD56]
MSRPWRMWRNAAYVVLVIIAAVLVVHWWPELAAIWRKQALTFVGTIVIMICGTLVQARNFLVFLDTPVRLRVRRFVSVWAWGALANYVAPFQAGGIAIRVAWLGRHKVSVADSLLATWRQLALSLWVALAGLAIGLLLIGDPRGRWPATVLFLLWLAAFFMRKLWLKWLDNLTRPAWLANRKQLMHRAVTGLSPSGLMGVVAQYVLGTLLLYWVYAGFDASIGFGQALILACLVYASSLVSILPGNLGVTEAIYMLGGHGFGLDLAQAGALAILIRAAHVATNLLIALVGMQFGGDGSGAVHE